MKSASKKESSLDRKELALRSNLKKRREYKKQNSVLSLKFFNTKKCTDC